MKRCEHAEALEKRPDVVAWVRRLRRLAREMPADVRVYIGNGTINVMDLCDEGTDGGPVERQRHIVADVGSGRWDGGDW